MMKNISIIMQAITNTRGDAFDNATVIDATGIKDAACWKVYVDDLVLIAVLMAVIAALFFVPTALMFCADAIHVWTHGDDDDDDEVNDITVTSSETETVNNTGILKRLRDFPKKSWAAVQGICGFCTSWGVPSAPSQQILYLDLEPLDGEMVLDCGQSHVYQLLTLPDDDLRED